MRNKIYNDTVEDIQDSSEEEAVEKRKLLTNNYVKDRSPNRMPSIDASQTFIESTMQGSLSANQSICKPPIIKKQGPTSQAAEASVAKI